MPDKTVDASFAGLLRLVTSPNLTAGASIDSAYFERTKTGARMRLPMGDRAAVIGADAVGGRAAPPESLIDWLSGDGAGPVMARLRVVQVEHSKGKFAAGTALPGTTMQGEFDTATGWPNDPSFGSHEYDLSSVIETKTEISSLVVFQSSDDLLDSVLEAHALAVSDKLLQQMLSGDNVGNNLDGIVNGSGIGGATYAVADRGGDEAFTAGEAVVEDAGGRSPFLAWAVGSELSDSLRTTAIEPGASRRTEEQGRLSLAGLPVQRVADGMVSTSGILCDWRSIVQIVASELELTVDRVTKPGYLRLTSRLAVASPVVTVPALVYSLTQF